jgi:hypothetical protein
MRTWVLFAWLIATAVIWWWFGKWVLFFAGIYFLFRFWMWLAWRYPMVVWFIIGFVRGLIR